jgi:glycosyltransferase involved in cell wall biosynthesis
MKILMVHPLLRSERIASRAGGMARVAMRLTEGLLDAGQEVAILPIPERFASYTELSLGGGKTVRVLPPMDLPIRRDIPRLTLGMIRQPSIYFHWHDSWYRLLMMAGIRNAIRAFRPDIIHNHHATSVFPEMVTALGERIPTVLTHHHFEPGVRLTSYASVIYPSEFIKLSCSASAGRSLPLHAVIFNPVDPVFSVDTGELPMRTKTLVFIGGINRRKGIMRVLHAYQLSRSLQGYPLTVFGDGELMEAARAYVDAHHLPVRFCGWQPPHVLRDALKQASGLVLPSQLESFGVAMAEALCCGAPIIGWGPTVRELESVLELPVGSPVEPVMQDAQELADNIMALLEEASFSEAWRNQMSDRAREYFRVERYVERNLSIYHRVLGRA